MGGLLAGCGGSAAPSAAPSSAPAQSPAASASTAPPASKPAASAAPASALASKPAASAGASAASKPAAGGLTKILDGMPNSGMLYLPHRVAVEKGFFQQQGFDATIQILAPNVMLPAIVSGEMAFGDSGGSGVRAAAQGLPIRMVDCHGITPLYWLALSKGINSVKDLEGKSVATNGVGDDTEAAGRLIVKKYGGDPAKVTWVAVGASTVRYAALESGKAAGAVLSLNETVKAQQASMILVNKPSDLPLSCTSGIVAAVNTIKQRPEEVTRFISAINQAIKFIQTNKDESVKILADWQKISPAEAQTIYDLGNVGQSFAIDQQSAAKSLEGQLQFSKDDGSVKANVSLADIADLSLMPKS